jgi:hypothetical protein
MAGAALSRGRARPGLRGAAPTAALSGRSATCHTGRCHSTVALHPPGDCKRPAAGKGEGADRRGAGGPGPRPQREVSRTQAASTAGTPGRTAAGKRGESTAAARGCRAGWRGRGVLDGSHHVTGKTTDRRLHDNGAHRRRRAHTRSWKRSRPPPMTDSRHRPAKTYPRSRRRDAASPRPPAPRSPLARASARSPTPNAPARSAPAENSPATCYGR